MEKLEELCFICGNCNCLEESDHEKMTFIEFDTLLKSKAGYLPEIAKIKHKIRKCYSRLEKITNQTLEVYVNELFLIIDKLHFWHLLEFLNSLKDIEAVIFGFNIPRNQIVRLLHVMNKEHDHNIIFPHFDLLLFEIHKFKSQSKKIIDPTSYNELAQTFNRIINECEKKFIQDSFVKSAKTESSFEIRPLHPEENCTEIILLEGIVFSMMRRSLDISILELTDARLIHCLPSLQKLREVTELQVRRSSLSQRGFLMLLNCFPNLETLDVSDCNSESFFQIVGKKLPKLKTLYANETDLDDQKLLIMMETMQNLRVIFADGNKIGNEGVEKLFGKKKNIMFASLKENLITDELGLTLQCQLAIKGGYIEY